MTLYFFFTCLFSNITLYTPDSPLQLPKHLDTLTISLLLSSGDNAGVFRDAICMTHRRPAESEIELVVIALEPGPLVLSDGLRLLPEQVFPRFEVPDILILCQPDEAPLDRPFLSFLRACLHQNTQVIVVANQFPQELVEFPLESSQRLIRCNSEDFNRCLQEALDEKSREAVRE